MAGVKVVSGYVEIPGHPRSAVSYSELGAELEAGLDGIPMVVGELEKVNETWMARALGGRGNISHSIADNPEKNSLEYHFVQHQKFQWMMQAHAHDGDDRTDVFVWIDYGILHVPGVTVPVIKRYLDRVADFGGQLMMPGCWPKREVPSDAPCWRFCGGLFAVPAPLVNKFCQVSMATALRQISATENVEWEVNTMARVELLDQLPITWYKADHNEKMFEALP